MNKDNFIGKIRKNIIKYNMIVPGDIVVIGLSGGADSISLIHSLNSLKDEFGFKIIAAHVNHGLRAEADEDENYCRLFCNRLGIEFHSKKVNIKALAKENHMGEEEMGRAVRYGFFRELSNGGKIATAHNKNDNVETVFMRMIRGTGIKGLCGIGYKNKDIIRPLLNISREEIERYVAENHLEYVTDKTNFQTIYTRNKIRLDIIPYIKDNLNKNIINTVGDNIEQYCDDNDCLCQLAEAAYSRVSYIKGDNVYLKINLLKNEHRALQRRIIIKAMQEVKGCSQDVANSCNIEDILNLLSKDSGKSFEFDKYICIVENGCLLFRKNKGEFRIYSLKESKITATTEIVNNAFKCSIPIEELKGNSFVYRERKDGDIVRIDDYSHKKLSKFLSDKKVPSIEREHLMVVALNDEIIMIPGYFSTRYNKRLGEFLELEAKI